MRTKRMKQIVTIGGGGGHAQVLKGLKALPGISITAICPSTDSGGSTGILVRDYGCLGYLGDLTKCIATLSPDERLSAALMQRFAHGPFQGHSLKNILLLGLGLTKDMGPQEALALMHRMCGISPHRAIPVSFERAELCATLEFGGKIAGETNIDNLAKNPLWSPDAHAIREIHLRPAARASGDALDAIRRSDHIVICPGDLYSSIAPVLLPRGVKSAVRRSAAQIIVMLNIMTKRGETDGYRAEDFIRPIEGWLGRKCDRIVLNDAPVPERSLFLYGTEKKIELSQEGSGCDPRIVRAPLVYVAENGRIFHDPAAIRRTLERIINEK